jgi:hypothetical protein
MPSLALIFHAADRAHGPGFVSSGSATVVGLSTPFSESDFGPVPFDCAERAAARCEYLEAHARRIYSGVTARVDTAVRLLGEKIRTGKLSDKFTSRDVYRPQWAGLTDRKDVVAALEILEEDLQWLRSETILPTDAGGRPKTNYYVNPRISQVAS